MVALIYKFTWKVLFKCFNKKPWWRVWWSLWWNKRCIKKDTFRNRNCCHWASTNSNRFLLESLLNIVFLGHKSD